jgi:hypothetical protein
MDDADGFRIEAAEQFGFIATDPGAGAYDGTYACSVQQVIAFAKACERAGMAAALKLVRITAQGGRDIKINAAPIALDVISGVLEHAVWKTDAELAPILAAEEARFMTAQGYVRAADDQPGARWIKPESKCDGCIPASVVPSECVGCGQNPADPPSKLCPGCQAYREHTTCS